jgi:RNA dependent RNA polymerase
MTLRFETAPHNRVTTSDPLHCLLLISFSDFRLRVSVVDRPGETEPATAKQSADYITRLLHHGIKVNGVHYNFYGHSNSQLKSRSCFLFAGSRQDISGKIEAMGDFSKLKSAGKKAKRIGLLFSTTEMGVQLATDRCEDIPDIRSKDYVFTDGCGLISSGLAKQLVKHGHIAFRNISYLPSVYQIRYRGYKGVLTLEPLLKGRTLVQFRESMRKFRGGVDLALSAVAYSKVCGDKVVLRLQNQSDGFNTALRFWLSQ